MLATLYIYFIFISSFFFFFYFRKQPLNAYSFGRHPNVMEDSIDI